MSIPVTLDDLAATMTGYGWAYLLTVRDDLRPHAVAVSPVWDGPLLTMPVGKGTASNAAARPAISLVFPPSDAGAYSLIVDGQAEVDGDRVRFSPTTAVLHRPAPEGFTGSASGCGADCLPLSGS